jgi:hypothetical protein
MSVHHTDLALMTQYNKISRFIFEKEQSLKAELEKPNMGLEAIKAELMKRLIERGADNVKTEAGTAYLSDHLNVKVVNRDALLAFAQKNWDNGGGALVVIKPPVDAVRDYMAMHEDKLPPGIETSTFTRINIRGGSK